MHRKHFIQSAGSLTIAFTLGKWKWEQPMPFQELPGSLRRQPNINAWLQVLANGRIRIFTGKMELGQGIRTAIAQVAAEELDMTMDKVEVVLAETGVTPNEGHTAGSGSIEQSAMSVRYASAAAKQKMLELASQKMKVPVNKLSLANGKIVAGNNRSSSFFELLNGKQITDEVKLPVPLKPKEQYKIVGKAIPRQDIIQMVKGAPHFVQDLRFPGMVYARVVRPPLYTAQLQSFDEQAVKAKVKGYLKTVVNGNFLAVICSSEYDAIQAQELMNQHSRWTTTPLPQVDDLKTYLKKLPVRTQQVQDKGTINTSQLTVKASYFKPYIMHGAMGPSCAVALYDNTTLQVWSHSQGVYPLRDTIARLLNLPAEKIHVKGVPGAGCYGHNGADDVAADVALMAMAYPGKHIMLQWSREDEHKWEPYGTAMIMELSAGLNSSGRITQWQYELWSDTHSTRPGGRPENTLAGKYVAKPFTGRGGGYSGGAYRNAEPYYAIPVQNIKAHFFDGPLRVSALRSLGAYANIFAIESFMDELAEKAGKDPYGFRLLHLQDERAKAVIRKLREMVNIPPASKNNGIGIAFSRYKNSASYCAVAALVNVNPSNNKVRVLKMWSAIDAGEAINIDGLKNQTEGGMVQSASWTLLEQVRFSPQQITSNNWTTYPVLRYDESPEAEVEVINYPNEEAMGAGEAAQGPAAAAIANAVYKACGKRVRDLPVNTEV